MACGAFHGGLRRDAVPFDERTLQRTAVDADADGHAAAAAGGCNRPDTVFPADVARVDADFIGARGDGLDRQPVVKVDVGAERNRRLLPDSAERPGSRHVRHGEPNQIAPGACQRAHLCGGCFDIGCFRIRHRLDGDARAAADGKRARVNLPRLPL